jgi:hypothetical protein
MLSAFASGSSRNTWLPDGLATRTRLSGLGLAVLGAREPEVAEPPACAPERSPTPPCGGARSERPGTLGRGRPEQRFRLSPREVAVDGGFQTKASEEALAPLAPERIHISGRASPGSKRTTRRLARYRVGVEGRISHLKRRHGLRRSRLKGGEGERTWTGWAVFAYNAETYGRHT